MGWAGWHWGGELVGGGDFCWSKLVRFGSVQRSCGEAAICLRSLRTHLASASGDCLPRSEASLLPSRSFFPRSGSSSSSSIFPMDAPHNACSPSSNISCSFEDFLPLMVEKLGEDGLMQELQKGFLLLADPSSQTITFRSLKQNWPLLGLASVSDEELLDMLSLGGGPELDLRGFCVAVIRTSPVFMQHAMDIILQDPLSDPAWRKEQKDDDDSEAVA